MAITVNLHSEKDKKLRVRSNIHTKNPDNVFTVVRMSVGMDEVAIFLSDIKDVERLAFEFSTLAQAMRDTQTAITE